jgi:sorting nexin-4
MTCNPKLQDAVTTAHDTSDAFSEETLREQKIFQRAKEAEMKEMLGNLADGQVEFYKSVSSFMCLLGL